MNRRHVTFAATAVIAFVAINGLLWHRETLLTSGERLHLRLDPDPPYALVRGDTITLRYAVADAIERERPENQGAGRAVLQVDEGVARFTRFYDGGPLADDERIVWWRHRNGIQIGPERCRLADSDKERYRRAAYGEFAVGSDGTAILIGLRDDQGEPIDGHCGVGR